MANPTLVDTDILIDAGRGVEKAVACLNELKSNSMPTISVISQMELMVGCRNSSEMQLLSTFLAQFQVIPLEASTSTAAVELMRMYRLSHGLLIADALIAATAVVSECPLISKNQRDYKFIEGLNLLPY